MPRRNGHLRWDKPNPRAGLQKGRGKKRPRDFHRSTAAGEQAADIRLPDVASGADPAAGAPSPVSKGRYRGSA